MSLQSPSHRPFHHHALSSSLLRSSLARNLSRASLHSLYAISNHILATSSSSRFYSRGPSSDRLSRRPTSPPRRIPTPSTTTETQQPEQQQPATYHQHQQTPLQHNQPQTWPAITQDPSSALLQPHVSSIPVVLPPESSSDIVKRSSGAASVLEHPGLMVGRQLEMMNVLIGFEQANKYAIKLSGTLLRQLMGTRRAFKAVVLDNLGNVVLQINRPVKWFLNSTITISDVDGNVIGEACAVTVDIDYFSRHSNSNGGFLPIPMVGGVAGGSSPPVPVPPTTGGGMGMPMPVIIPGMGGFGEFLPDDDASGGGGGGGDEFLSDEQAGVGVVDE
ncbi:hypothetical protein HDU76_002462, partial [Blyttiomyces sp. JEL0837]